MIIANGFIQFVHTEGGGRNPQTGYLEKPSEVLGERIPCQRVLSRMNRLARAGTEPTESISYTIYIDSLHGTVPKGASLVLSDKNGDEIGRFSIISEEYLDAVGQIRLIV